MKYEQEQRARWDKYYKELEAETWHNNNWHLLDEAMDALVNPPEPATPLEHQLIELKKEQHAKK